ncbi:thiol:disulfide interchange protein [Caulobacter sp. Root487D2Y]|uniref:TlpA family protein disulfide reductase n=1 Tax=Caulobacter sp. Root487D2Y TaxID=1736547 RepID=UPI0006F352B1|nr:TlpA disulfide reductase family protein [Caulobacter sp. Root487D2Y]KQY30280.1 thiol:disulfide interchange protein [Caulobacter sp. Root487D2Y]
MSEVQSNEGAGGRKPSPLKWAIGAVLLIGVAAVLYVMAQASFKPAGVVDLKEFKKASLEKLDIPAEPRAAPATVFTDGAGKPHTLADFKGQVVVMNLWATWCAPCKKEMPTLGKLQAAYATQPLKVLPISVDRDSDLNLVQAEMAANPPLQVYRDPGYKLSFELDPRAVGYPTTVIYDKQGRERARLSGDADWSSPEARGLVEALLRER